TPSASREAGPGTPYDSANHLRSRHIKGMIDQGLHPFDESHGMRQPCMVLEGIFVDPARVNVEQSRIPGRAKGVNAQAAGFLAGRTENITQRLLNSTFITCAGVKTREDE